MEAEKLHWDVTTRNINKQRLVFAFDALRARRMILYMQEVPPRTEIMTSSGYTAFMAHSGRVESTAVIAIGTDFAKHATAKILEMKRWVHHIEIRRGNNHVEVKQENLPHKTIREWAEGAMCPSWWSSSGGVPSRTSRTSSGGRWSMPQKIWDMVQSCPTTMVAAKPRLAKDCVTRQHWARGAPSCIGDMFILGVGVPEQRHCHE